MDTIAFKKVKEPYGWLSNMSPHPVGGFRTAEAMFQALRFADFVIIDAIKECSSPMGAKFVAKKHVAQMVVTPRSEADLGNMKQILRLKLEQHPELKAQLLATGDALIIEDVSARPNESGLFWGAAKAVGGVWFGKNMLGKMWMDARTWLRTVEP